MNYESDQDGIRRALLLGDRADGAHRDGRGHGDTVLGGQVLLAQAVEETAGERSREGFATAGRCHQSLSAHHPSRLPVAVAAAVAVADALSVAIYLTGVRCAFVQLLPQVRHNMHLAAPRHGTDFLRKVSYRLCYP